MRKFTFTNNEYYHIYNRGVDKRTVFEDTEDLERFLLSLTDFNSPEAIGSIYGNSFKKELVSEGLLVNIIAYCLNPNHFHLILEQTSDKGVEKFMQRLGTGYTMYFNNKYKRNGTLFQGRFKAKHINNNEYLIPLSVYVNLNNRIHQLGGSTSKLVDLVKNSWEEYTNSDFHETFCKKDIILDQFKNKADYKKFALDLLPSFIESKVEQKELEYLT